MAENRSEHYDHIATETAVVNAADAPDDSRWTPAESTALASPVDPGEPSTRPEGEDLDLHMGWDRFEKLVWAISRHVLGLRGVRVRRYGTQGQAQHGIDLAGRGPDGEYTVVQCKEYDTFKAADLRKAVETFANGRRPFDARKFVVATSDTVENTQIVEELANLQDEYTDLEIDLWGSAQLNDYLRHMADVVTRFWTRETAHYFCTSAALPGVPAPPLNRQEQADRILLGPLNTPDVKPLLHEAERQRHTDASRAAHLYNDLAERLQEAGFHSHALVMRRRQMTALHNAQSADEAIALAGDLAVLALRQADRSEAQALVDQACKYAREAANESVSQQKRQRVVELLQGAISAVERAVGPPQDLWQALLNSHEEDPHYQPQLVLLLAEDIFATEPQRLPDLDEVLIRAINDSEVYDEELSLRLRLARAEFDQEERKLLLRMARRREVQGRQIALISAREARRCCLEGRADEAVESWRDAVEKAIHCDLAHDAASWLYSIRLLNFRFGQWPEDFDKDEHRLAQALRSTASKQLLDRVRDPREAAMSAAARQRPIESVLWGRQWLIDSAVTGSWADETEAAEFLGDIYQTNKEPGVASQLFQRVGNVKKVRQLANDVGDLLLPSGPLSESPWWVLRTRAAQVSAQADLLDDDTATLLLDQLIDLARRGRSGELLESRTHELTLQATHSACRLVGRGTTDQAATLLDLLSGDVPRKPGSYRHTDDEHAKACVEIALKHDELTYTALTRLIELADQDVQSAQNELAGERILDLLRGSAETASPTIDEEERNSLHRRVVELAENRRYLADVVLANIEPSHPLVHERIEEARERILTRAEPDLRQTSFGTSLVYDSHLIRLLPPADSKPCLDKYLDIACDSREAAANRQDALTAAATLVADQHPTIKSEVFARARAFVSGDQDGSHLDDLTGEPHPLSRFKINMGSPSLRGHGLKLAYLAAVTTEEQKWTREQAVNLLKSSEKVDINAAAGLFASLSGELAAGVDASLLATHQDPLVRQASALLCLRDPSQHTDVLRSLATDRNFHVRRLLADSAARSQQREHPTVNAILNLLAKDARHSVRRAAVQRH